MWHVGMDWHSRQTDLTVRDANGRKMFSRHVRGGVGEVIAELRKIGKPFSVTYEASTGYGHVFDELSKVAHTVKVAHPGHLRLIFRSKRKSDRVDSDKLSKLDYLGEVPQVHVPRHEVRSRRATIKYRNRMVLDRTATKCRIRASLRSLGVAGPKSLWTNSGIEWLRGLELAEEFDALMRDELVERLGHQDALVRRVTKALDRRARAHPGVRRSPRIRAYCERIRRGDPDRKKIAIVATAHYLVRVTAAMLRTGEVRRDEQAMPAPASDSPHLGRGRSEAGA